MDETGLTTTRNPGELVSQRGLKQIGPIASQKEDLLSQWQVGYTSSKNFIPLFSIFPLK